MLAALLVATGRVSLGVGLLVGTMLFNAQLESALASRLDTRYEGDSLVAEFVVSDFPVVAEHGVRFYAESSDHPFVPSRVLLNWRDAPAQPRIGDRWQLEVRLRKPRSGFNPGSPDYEKLSLARKVDATGYVVASKRNQLRLADQRSVVIMQRLRALERLENDNVGPDTQAVLAAITTGTRHLIGRELWQTFATTGTSHLMAISGLHVGLVAVVTALLARLVLGLSRLRCNQRQMAMLCGLSTSLWFALIAGFATPTLRASIMLLVAGLLLASRRRVCFADIILATVLCVLLVDPLDSLSAGFSLSFAAVACLSWLAHRLPGSGLLRKIRALVSMQCLLVASLALLTAMYFGRVSLVSPAVNALAIPVFSIVTTPFALLSVHVPWLPGSLADLSLSFAADSMDWLLILMQRAGHWRDASLVLPDAWPLAWFTLGSLLIAGVLPVNWPGRAVGAAALLVLMYPSVSAMPQGCFEARFLDVGQGQAVLLRTHKHSLLYDTGPAFAGGSAMESTILPALDALSVTSLDKVIVSHADLDHAGGVEDLLDSLPVRELRVGELLDGEPGRQCHGRQAWVWDGVHFRILHPQPGSSLSGNNRSCVLLVSARDRKLLLTGDIEREVEHELRRTMRLNADVVSVPHHGSHTSSTTGFIKAVDSDLAIVSAAYRNRWNFPRKDVIERWQDHGTRVLNTGHSGALTVRSCVEDDEFIVSQEREDRRRLWHD